MIHREAAPLNPLLWALAADPAAKASLWSFPASMERGTGVPAQRPRGCQKSMTSRITSVLPLPSTVETALITEQRCGYFRPAANGLLSVRSRFLTPTLAHDQTLATHTNARVSATDLPMQNSRPRTTTAVLLLNKTSCSHANTEAPQILPSHSNYTTERAAVDPRRTSNPGL
jgi:hypothetical protein